MLATVLATLAANSIFDVLDRRLVEPDRPFSGAGDTLTRDQLDEFP